MIYRVEHRMFANGPYTPHRVWDMLCDCGVDDSDVAAHEEECEWAAHEDLANNMRISHSDSDHPTPWADELINISHYEVCGFADFDSLLYWFSEYTEWLHDLGYVANVFESDDARVSSTTGQAVFFPGNSVDTLSLV